MAEQKENEHADIIRIKAVPETKPNVDDHFVLSKNEDIGQLKDDDLLVQPEYLSVDPYQRGRMKGWFAADHKQMLSLGVCKVLKSKSERFKEGDYVYSGFGWGNKQIVPAKYMMMKVPPDLSEYKPKEEKKYGTKELEEDDDGKFDVADIGKISHSYYIGSYGMPGQTAYFGMIFRGGLKKGDNVLITGAAGAVGSIAGQIAKIYGCHVVGVCGSAEKIKWITEDLGFDAAINYKEYGDDYDKVQATLKEKFPNGIDLFFDNVGGVFNEAVWDLMNKHGRVVICGQIASYNADPNNPKLIRPFLGKIIYKELDIRGLHVEGYGLTEKKFYYDMGRWILSGKVKVRETVIEGFDKLPEAFCGLFTGKNIGKMVVKCS